MATLPVTINARQAQDALRAIQKQYNSLANSIQRQQKSLASQQKAIASVAKAAGALFVVQNAAQYVQYMSQISDQYTLIDAKIKLISKTQEEFTTARKELLDLSVETGTTLAANAQAFAKLGNSMKGARQEEVIDYLETVNKSLIVSGATTQEATGFMIQFAQAMGSGVVNGDELRTMNEANSYLMAQIADQFDTNIAGLKEMGAANILTTELFAEALATVASSVEKDYANIPVTIARAWNEVNEIWKNALTGGDNAAEATQGYVESIQNLGSVIEQNAPAIQNLFNATIQGAAFLVDQIGVLDTAIEGLEAASKGQISYWDAIFGTTSSVKAQLAEIANENKLIVQYEERISEINKEIQKVKSERPWTEGGRQDQQEQLDLLRQQRELLRDSIQLVEDNASKEVKLSVSTETLDAEFSSLQKTQRTWINAWLRDNEDAYGETIETLEKKLKKLGEGDTFNFKNSDADLADQLREIARGGLEGVNAWKDLNLQIEEYKNKAAEAGKAGNWEEQIGYLERTEKLINKMSTSADTRAVTDKDVENAKKVWEYQQRITSGGRNAYGDAAKPYEEARKNYEKLLRAQKEGTLEVVTSEEKRKEKTEQLIEINDRLEAARKSGAKSVTDELAKTKATLEAYKEGNVLEIEGLEDTAELLDNKIDKVEEVRESWIKYGDKVIRIQDEVMKSIEQVNLELEKQIELQRTAGGSITSNGSTVSTGSPRARGGRVNAGISYPVGEKGMEMFTPSSAGYITPNNQVGSGSNSVIDIHISTDDGERIQVQGTQDNADSLVRLLKDKARFSS